MYNHNAFNFLYENVKDWILKIIPSLKLFFCVLHGVLAEREVQTLDG